MTTTRRSPSGPATIRTGRFTVLNVTFPPGTPFPISAPPGTVDPDQALCLAFFPAGQSLPDIVLTLGIAKVNPDGSFVILTTNFGAVPQFIASAEFYWVQFRDDA